MIEGLTRSLRLEHFAEACGHQNPEDKLRVQLEEERRHQEKEERRARQRERLTRDPHRKVALKLENRRRFGRSRTCPSGRPEVPMMTVDIVGSRGLEKVELVDLRTLRSRCHPLGSGTTVRSLLEHQRNQERWVRSRTSVRSGIQASSSTPSLALPSALR